MRLHIRPKLAGKIVIVTGASSGIGEAAAHAFAQAGAIVVLAARRAYSLERLATEINAAGGRALAVPTDLLDVRQITYLVQKTMDEFGRIDVLANIAGWGRYDWYEELSPEDLRKQFEVNVLAMAELTRQVVPIMQRQRSGHIINMSSYASRIAIPIMTVYASTKYAVEGLSDGLRRELAPWGIKVTRVHPGGVSGTEFNRKAAQRGGIEFKAPRLARVSKEQVARQLVELVERPRRSLFIGRIYSLGVFFNRRLPSLVDTLSGLGVRWARREALRRGTQAGDRTRVRLPQIAALAGSLFLGILILGSLLQRKSCSRPRSTSGARS